MTESSEAISLGWLDDLEVDAEDAQFDRWVVLHTRSRQEKVVAGHLDAHGVNHFLPLVSHVRHYGKRRANVELPLFPGYVFLYGSNDQAYEADRTKRLARIIQVPNQSQLTIELKNLHLALARQAPLDPYPYLRQGIWVEVRSGPFQGVQGVIDDRKNSHRLILKIDVLGQAASLEIDGALLEPR